MKKLIITSLMLMILCMYGCMSRVVKDNVRINVEAQKEYVQRMDGGLTTPEQDKAVIKAQLKNWEAIDRYVNGEKK